MATALAELTFCRLGNFFTEPSAYDETQSCTTLCFVTGTGLLAE
jgi:hypothetical protein